MTFSQAINKRLLELCKTLNKIAILSGIDRGTLAKDIKNSGTFTLYKVATTLNMTFSEFHDFPEMNEIHF